MLHVRVAPFRTIAYFAFCTVNHFVCCTTGAGCYAIISLKMKLTEINIKAVAAATVFAVMSLHASEAGHVGHVVLIGVDGLGVRNIPWERMPNLTRLRDKGKYTVARSLFPTISGLNWASCMYGTIPDMHGFRDATPVPEVKPAIATKKGRHPCIFSEIRRQEQEAYTCSLYNWVHLANCYEKADVSLDAFREGFSHDRESAYTDEFIEKLLPNKPRFSFLYYGTVDETGHFKGGWNSSAYNDACADVDSLIGRVAAAVEAAMPGDVAIIVVADHGGEKTGHGSTSLECYEIPFIVHAPGLDDYVMREPVAICDVAPTVAWLLGMEIPECWRGRPALRRIATSKGCKL